MTHCISTCLPATNFDLGPLYIARQSFPTVTRPPNLSTASRETVYPLSSFEDVVIISSLSSAIKQTISTLKQAKVSYYEVLPALYNSLSTCFSFFTVVSFTIGPFAR